jgi:hypothetical protein
VFILTLRHSTLQQQRNILLFLTYSKIQLLLDYIDQKCSYGGLTHYWGITIAQGTGMKTESEVRFTLETEDIIFPNTVHVT